MADFNTKCCFSTVLEHDIDVLVLQLIILDEEFVKLFLKKTGKDFGEISVDSVELSKSDPNLGESDITVIVNTPGKKVAILIEDKINAIAMPRQPERYIKRGEKAVAANEYDEFYSFIICPQKYYDNNDAAKKYPFVLMYEEIREYLESKTEPVYQIFYQEICQAIERAKKPAQVEIVDAANCFNRSYIEYQKEHYPTLDLRTKEDVNGYWTQFATRFGNTYLLHKIQEGKADLTFSKAAANMVEMETIADWLRTHGLPKVHAEKTGKSVALRVNVPKLNMMIPFEENDEEDIRECFDAISELVEAARIFGVVNNMARL